MGEDKSTHSLEMRHLRTANIDGGGQKHALPRDEGDRHDRQDCMQMRQVCRIRMQRRKRVISRQREVCHFTTNSIPLFSPTCC